VPLGQHDAARVRDDEIEVLEGMHIGLNHQHIRRGILQFDFPGSRRASSGKLPDPKSANEKGLR
jgi:hypothetical protein